MLHEASAVAAALRELGWEPVELDLTPDLDRAARELAAMAPAFVFNLVESVEGRGRYILLAQTLLETLGIPFTGAGLEAMIHSTSKPATKRLLEPRRRPHARLDAGRRGRGGARRGSPRRGS